MEISKKMPLSRTLVSWCNFLPFLFSKKDYDHAVPVLLSVFEMLPFFKLCHVYLSFEATVKPSLLFLQKRFLQRRSILNEHLSTSIIIYVQRTRKRDLCIFYRYHGLPIVSPKHRDLTRSRSDLSSRNQSCWILSRENRTWIMKKILQGR